MEKMGNYVDMALSPQEQAENMPIAANIDTPKYPWGLCISLTNDELEKMGVEAKDFQVGDMINFDVLGKVTAVSERDASEGPCCRVEIQITGISVEDDEDEEQEYKKPSFVKNPYSKK